MTHEKQTKHDDDPIANSLGRRLFSLVSTVDFYFLYLSAPLCIDDLDEYLLLGFAFSQTKRATKSHFHDIRLLHSASVFALCLVRHACFSDAGFVLFHDPSPRPLTWSNGASKFGDLGLLPRSFAISTPVKS
ncbi:hypothetical protein NX059_005611 [Plenodomus lindquistii]|nr:hypothetical protein NX059_005611 [Plenodomus lindquistii]